MTSTTGTAGPLPPSMEERAAWLADAGGLDAAIDAGRLAEPVALPLAEALVLGLMRQGVTKYLAIFGHGSTAIGEVLRVYQAHGLVRCWQFRNEVAMAHAATALRWVYGESSAVVTSIGPGAMQALAGSLAAASNGIGVYHLYGDETTHGEGYNMQQVPKPAQGMFGQMTALMGEAWTLHSPGGLRAALRRGAMTVFHPWKAGPFYLNLPLNTQPADDPGSAGCPAGGARVLPRRTGRREGIRRGGGASSPTPGASRSRPAAGRGPSPARCGSSPSWRARRWCSVPARPGCCPTTMRRTCMSAAPRGASAATSRWKKPTCWWSSAAGRCARATARAPDGRRSATSSTSTPIRRTSSTTTARLRSAAMPARCWSG